MVLKGTNNYKKMVRVKFYYLFHKNHVRNTVFQCID